VYVEAKLSLFFTILLDSKSLTEKFPLLVLISILSKMIFL